MYNPDTYTLKTRGSHFAHPHHIEESECSPVYGDHFQGLVWACCDRHHDRLLTLEKDEVIEVFIASTTEAHPLPERMREHLVAHHMKHWKAHLAKQHLARCGEMQADMRPIDTMKVTLEPVTSPTSGRSGVKLVFTQTKKPHRRRWYRQWLKTAIL